MAQVEGDEPEWFADLDPLDTLFLGTVWPRTFPDGYEFANALTRGCGCCGAPFTGRPSSGSSGRRSPSAPSMIFLSMRAS